MRYILSISALVSVGLSALFSLLPAGMYNQAQVSALFDTLFTPAGFTFSIWSSIYLSWIGLGIWVLVKNIPLQGKHILLLAVAQIVSSLWLIPSQYLYISTSLIVMGVLLGLVGVLFFSSRDEHRYFRFTGELFFGWILIAFIANIHLVLVAADMYYFPIFLTVASLIITIAINIFLIHRYTSYIPSLVAIWAFFGIIVGQKILLIQTTSSVGILVLSLLILYRFWKSQKNLLL